MGSMLVLHWSSANDGWYFSVLPWLVPGVALALVVSIVATGRLARWFSVPRVVAWVLIMSTGVILAATMTPLGRPGARAPV
jgi:hypothetical protein